MANFDSDVISKIDNELTIILDQMDKESVVDIIVETQSAQESLDLLLDLYGVEGANEDKAIEAIKEGRFTDFVFENN